MKQIAERVLVTGASRGLGLEFVRQWLDQGRRVFALARDPDGSDGLATLREEHLEALTLIPCEVTDEDSIAAAAHVVGQHVDGLEIVVNNAGIRGPRATHLDDLDLEAIRRVFDVNTLGPLRVTRAFQPLLEAGTEPRRVVHVSSLMGSIGDNSSGGSYAYRVSKSALNMISCNLAFELADSRIVSMVIHPGWVRTDLGGPSAPLTVEQSVSAMRATIGRLTMDDSGTFLDRDGETLPW
jgi:NAD(P)-dependent dehydrogenase (short-subunit alcohol dehydrogenase family)